MEQVESVVVTGNPCEGIPICLDEGFTKHWWPDYEEEEQEEEF